MEVIPPSSKTNLKKKKEIQEKMLKKSQKSNFINKNKGHILNLELLWKQILAWVRWNTKKKQTKQIWKEESRPKERYNSGVVEHWWSSDGDGGVGDNCGGGHGEGDDKESKSKKVEKLKIFIKIKWIKDKLI